MQNFELRLVIVILKLVTWMKRLDIWINNSNNSEVGWISISESWIIIKKKFFLWSWFRLECQKIFCVWFIRKTIVGTEQGSLEYKQFSSSLITFFCLFWQELPPIIKPLPSQICWSIRVRYDKIGARVVQR